MSNWPQIILLTIYALSLGHAIGSGRRGVASMIAVAINLSLLYAGGFFACLGIAP